MLDLHSSIHLDEVELASLVQEFKRAGSTTADVAACQRLFSPIRPLSDEADRIYRHCFSSLIHSEPGNVPGLMNAFMTLASTREQLLSKLFAGSADPKATDPTEKTAPLFGAVKYTISARTWCSNEPESP